MAHVINASRLSSRRSVGVFARISQWIETLHQRAKLRTLDDRALRDIGLTEGVALRESLRPFWDR